MVLLSLSLLHLDVHKTSSESDVADRYRLSGTALCFYLCNNDIPDEAFLVPRSSSQQLNDRNTERISFNLSNLSE